MAKAKTRSPPKAKLRIVAGSTPTPPRKPVLGKDQVSMFEMTQLINQHVK